MGTGRAARGVVFSALGCAGLLATGCASSGPTSGGHPSRAANAPPAATSPAAPGAGLATGAARRSLAARYLAIAVAGNHHLETDFDGLTGDDRHNLAAARADLRDAAATERLFDRRLLAIGFPPATEAIAGLLVASNQARAAMASQAATSSSLRQVHAWEPRLTAANGPVEEAVRVIRSQLGLPPPHTS